MPLGANNLWDFFLPISIIPCPPGTGEGLMWIKDVKAKERKKGYAVTG